MPTIDDVMSWGRYPDMTYRGCARRNPGYMKWAAVTIGGLRGALVAEALAIHLGVV